MYYWGKPQFYGVKAQASNVGRRMGSYTAEQFQEDFPQFFNGGNCLVPSVILSLFLDRANRAIQPDRWLDGWRYACGLYVAHYSTMYLRTYTENSCSPEQAASTGALVGVVSSATLGDASVSYDTDALTKATEQWGSLNATQYGQMLASEARMVGMGGTYVL